MESQKSGLMPVGWTGTKQELRDELRTRPEGEKLWQTLQGRVYGPLMSEAEMFPGVASFLMRIRNRGGELFIVSHKTEYGHFDSTRTDLRRAALNWMESQGLFNPNRYRLNKDQVYFTSTRKEKVRQIADLNCDAFIDDLEEVFTEEHFPAIKRILFNSSAKRNHHDYHCRNWTEIAELVLGKLTASEYKELVESFFPEKLVGVHPLQGRGNSRVFRIETEFGKTYALKAYPDLLLDPRPRLQTEVKTSRFLRSLNLTSFVEAYDVDLNLALFEWIEGKSPRLIDSVLIEQALGFIKKLKEQSGESYHEFFQASEACLLLNELESQIEKRFDKLVEIENLDLQKFLISTAMPLWSKIRRFSRSMWPASTREKELPRLLQTLSPSDFGFHNSIQKKDGSLCFIDMEYFGWDDPVKLIADFIWHPGMELKDVHKKKWVEEALKIFSKDSEIKSRFQAAWPLYGMRWILIILNEFREDGWKKRRIATLVHKLDREKILKLQLQKAMNLCYYLENKNLLSPYV